MVTPVLVLHDRDMERQKRDLPLSAESGEDPGDSSTTRRVARLAHDLNNALVPVVMLAASLEDEVSPDPLLRARLAEIRVAAARALSIVRREIDHLRGGEPQPAPISVQAHVIALRPALEMICGERITLDLSGISAEVVLADRDRLEAALVDLVINARDAIPDLGRISIRTRSVERVPSTPPGGPSPSGPMVVIEVSDTGAGIPETLIPRVFERFVTTKSVGSGLGLWNVKSFAEDSGGFAEVESTQGVGTRFSLYLPRA
jgi:signal transduction histidine kinase